MLFDMSRKRLILLLAASILCGTINAQSIQRAQEYYRIFVNQCNSPGNTSQAYSTLYKCYTECSDILNAGCSAEAKTIMRNIWPYLYNGAVYNSQKGLSTNALLFAKAYVDIPLSKEFATESFRHDDTWPTMVYFAASGTYNSKDYKGAIPYFREYIRTGATEKRKDVYKFMAKAYSLTGDHADAISVLDNAVSSYPSDFNILSMAINACIDAKDNNSLQKFVTKAMKIKPDDETLLNIQGKLYEDTGEYQKAYSTYGKLQQLRPKSLEVAKHLALNAYNLGVLYHNRNLVATDPAAASRYAAMSKDYFRTAIPTFQSILASEPASVKYMEGLAVIYNCMGNEREVADINNRLAAAGGRPVNPKDVPTLLAYDSHQQPAVTGNHASPPSQQSTTTAETAPTYSSYAKAFVEERLQQWQAKDPYETISEYRQRVTEAKRDEKVKELLKEAEQSYISTWSSQIRLEDIVLKPYDAENEVFLAESQYGDIVIPVPRARNEAKIFESGWNAVKFRNPEYSISNDRIVISKLTFVTPTGNVYTYDGTKSLNYTETVVDVAFQDIDYKLYSSASADEKIAKVQKSKVSIGASDVDKDIPTCNVLKENTFAVVIANENYETVSRVPLALNDGKIFSEYCRKVLGVPENHIRYYEDATYGAMLRAMKDIKEIAATYKPGEMDVIFYYAGHGVPDEATKDSYLLPVDGDGQQTEVCYPLGKLYSELGNLNAGNVLVFLDACFSGSNRDDNMVTSAGTRKVALAAKPATPVGNMVIFSAASGDETAYPYDEKGHGLFTYFLLKKLKETAGNVTLGELQEYITENVRRQSVIVNHKSQTPNVSASVGLAGKWQGMNLK
ncbi:MAG: hypothetical protein E7117_00970 [Bacteroidales bacterium]|nr:hypothetical protein [Bacteroidales bacterium]